MTNWIIGGIVGEIPCPIPTFADDMTELSDSKGELQTLVVEGDDYSTLERYLLQPVKSVVMPVPGRGKKPVDTGDFVWTINGKPLPIVQETTHMGIKRSAISNEATVEENIKKARKMLYSLMGPGLHGYNGLDPETAVHIYQTYVLPTESLCQLFRRQRIWVSRDQLYPMRQRWKKTSRKLGKCCTV